MKLRTYTRRSGDESCPAYAAAAILLAAVFELGAAWWWFA